MESPNIESNGYRRYSNASTASLSDDEIVSTFKQSTKWGVHMNKSRISDFGDETDSASSEDDMIDSLDMKADIRTNIALQQKRHSLLPAPSNKPALRSRSYSEATLRKDDDENNADDIYQKYVLMKKKYKKQRRISKQFQEAITSIQDDNEDAEETIRSEYEKEFEMKLIKLEHDKLNKNIAVEERMKQLMSQNQHLMNENKQLQTQVVAQVNTIQHQQQLTIHQQELLTRQLSAVSAATAQTTASPMATCGNITGGNSYPSVHSSAGATPGFGSKSATCSVYGGSHGRRITLDDFQLDTLTFMNNDSCNVEVDEDDQFIKYKPPMIDSGDGEDDDYNNVPILDGLTPMSTGTINIHNINMDPAFKYAKNNKVRDLQRLKSSSITPRNPQQIIRNKQRKKLDDLEAKLMQKDEEMKKKIGDGLSPWDRFWELMTPNFCSCSPPTHTAKTINE